MPRDQHGGHGWRADGYTSVLVALPHATNPAVFASLPYDTFKEFIGLVHMVNIPVILTVKFDSPIRTFADRKSVV